VSVASIMVSGFGIEWDIADDSSLGPFAVVDAGEVQGIIWDVRDTLSDQEIQLMVDGSWVVDLDFDPCEDLRCVGTYEVRRKPSNVIPEPNAATLFTLGALLAATRVRRTARS